MKIWVRLKNSGYRIRLYLFAAMMVLLVVTSLTYTFGVTWYSKRLFALIAEKDFKARETERELVDLLVSMDRIERRTSFWRSGSTGNRSSRTRDCFVSISLV